ncbi:MAG: Holliday junction branch migration protein RuvA [Bacteroidota bacterium]
MIAYLKGNIAQLDPAFVVIDCRGVGYMAKISLYTYDHLQGKKEVLLHTFLLVREDAHTLYGFANTREKSMFEQLITVSGVGANTALVMLSSMEVEELFHAIRTEDVLQLKRIKGIGAKSAARIVLELKDKLKLEGTVAEAGRKGGPSSGLKQEALAALISLGLPKATMEKRLDDLVKAHGSDISVEQLVKLALRNP